MSKKATFFLILGIILFSGFFVSTSLVYAQSQSPSFFPLAPCPSCTEEVSPPADGDISPVMDETQPSGTMIEPSAPVDPCTASELAGGRGRHGKSKHKHHSGEVSGGIEELLKLLLKLIQMLMELFGGGNFNMPNDSNPQPDDSDPIDSPNYPNDQNPGEPSPFSPPPCPEPSSGGDNPGGDNQGGQNPQPSDSSQQPLPSGGSQPSQAQPSAGAALPPGTTGTTGQKLGCGGIPAPAASEKLPANGTISGGGTAGSPKVYDGACQQVGTITIKANYVTVQNFKIMATGQYGILSEGTGITIQNNDIKGVKASGDGDLNAITFFGNDTKILYNTAIDFVSGSPGGSHTDAIQTWISDSHPTGSTKVLIKGNKFSGPQNPSRDSNIASIHQCIMAEGPGKGGNSGGSGSSGDWVIANNYFLDSWNQCIKLDGINNVTITGNEFAGSSDKVMDVPSTTAKYYSDNKVTGQYKNGVGMTVTQGTAPASPL